MMKVDGFVLRPVHPKMPFFLHKIKSKDPATTPLKQWPIFFGPERDKCETVSKVLELNWNGANDHIAMKDNKEFMGGLSRPEVERRKFLKRRSFLKRSGAASMASLLPLLKSSALHSVGSPEQCVATCHYTTSVVEINFVKRVAAVGAFGIAVEQVHFDVTIVVSNTCYCYGLNKPCVKPEADFPSQFEIEFQGFCGDGLQDDVMPPGVSDIDSDGDGAPDNIDAEQDFFDNPNSASVVGGGLFTELRILTPIPCDTSREMTHRVIVQVLPGENVGVWEVNDGEAVPGGGIDAPRLP